MLRLKDKTIRAISSLKKTAPFIELIHYLEEEQDSNIKSLMVASTETVQKQQGRTKFIQELLDAIENID